jgi:hypothetical protein
MTPQQIRTSKRIALAGILFVAWVVYLLVAEFFGVKQGGESTISEVMWLAWVAQPWVIWLVSVVLAFITGFLSGHFFGQSSAVYDAIRRGDAPPPPKP